MKKLLILLLTLSLPFALISCDKTVANQDNTPVVNESVSSKNDTPNEVLDSNSKESTDDKSEEVANSDKVVKNLSEKDVRTMTIASNKIVKDVIHIQNLDETQVIEQDSRSFAPSKTYKNIDEVKEAFKPYFTNEAVDEFLTEYTITKDGTLYFAYGQRGVKPNPADSLLTMIISEEGFKLTATYQLFDNGEAISEDIYSFELNNEKWVMSKILL